MQRIDMRPTFSNVRDQGSRGTCVAFAVTAGHEYKRCIETGSMVALSDEVLHFQCKVIDGNRDSGTSFSSAGQALQTVGQPLENKWLYDKLRDETQPDYSPPPDAVDPQHCYRANLTPIQANMHEIVTCLERGKPVAIGIPMYASFFTASAGRVPMPLAHEKVVGGHAVLAVGCEQDSQQAQWLIFRNSWGMRWGRDGYGFLQFQYIENYGCKAFIVEA